MSNEVERSRKMQRSRTAVVIEVSILIGLLSINVFSQESAAEHAADLRAQLIETQARQAELQTHLQQLEEDLKPENIERSLAGVGSTHPEALREQRRRQLEIEKKGLESQLEVLAARRTRLEAAVAHADTESYRESADVGPGSRQPPLKNAAAAGNRVRRRRKIRAKKRQPILRSTRQHLGAKK
jgi:cell division protein FtsB